MTQPRTTGCQQCGNCCRLPGYVHLRRGEEESIAAHLGLSIPDFTSIFTRLADNRQGLSLTEKTDGSCIFLLGNNCGIQAVKPGQCRDFPMKWRFEGWQTTCAGDYDP